MADEVDSTMARLDESLADAEIDKVLGEINCHFQEWRGVESKFRMLSNKSDLVFQPISCKL